MRTRIFIYMAAGCLFGIAVWYLSPLLDEIEMTLSFLPFALFWSFFLTIGCAWGTPAVLVAFIEARQTQSIWRPALAAALFWTTAIIAYYLYYAALIAITGEGQLEFLRIVNASNTDVWNDWAWFFMENVIPNITEWIPIAMIGGALIGWLVGVLYRRKRRLRAQTTEAPVAPN
ncbi:MAG: hypothetical protein MI924_38250 [Chloroflexales bacterium]|nr:hypothetical protein [Chloroflexales bacterium]